MPGTDLLQFYVRLVPGGAFSDWLASAKAGDAVELSAPHGTFFLRDEDRPRLFVAGGNGRRALPVDAAQHGRASAQTQPTTVVIGARTHGHLFALAGARAARRAGLPGLDLQVAVEQDGAAGLPSGYADRPHRATRPGPLQRACTCAARRRWSTPGRKAAEAAGIPRPDVLCERFRLNPPRTQPRDHDPDHHRIPLQRDGQPAQGKISRKIFSTRRSSRKSWKRSSPAPGSSSATKARCPTRATSSRRAWAPSRSSSRATRSSKVHVFLNSCRHRGMKVCQYDHGNTQTLHLPVPQLELHHRRQAVRRARSTSSCMKAAWKRKNGRSSRCRRWRSTRARCGRPGTRTRPTS